MTSAPTNPVDVPPFQIQTLISQKNLTNARCGCALGSEIYVGCSNGDLIRFALQADGPNSLESYSEISRQSLPNEKPIEEIVIIPSLFRALVFSDHQIHFYTLPTLDPVPANVIKPIRHVYAFAVDQAQLRRPSPPLSAPISSQEPVDFCVIKRNAIAMYSLRDRLFYQKEIPLPTGGVLARRSGQYLCIADKAQYNLVDLANASLIPMLPVNQSPDAFNGAPSICVTSENPAEFLILSWTGASTLGVFINHNGDPVRGTLEWPHHPRAVVLDYPYVAALLPNRTIEIHSLETQSIMQVLPAPHDDSEARLTLSTALSAYLVPSTQKSDKMRRVPVNLFRS
ncbi:CNH domain-containing protein [Mycena indigotica]|uniref:CNH domain-containing protein n=1 Tax=Mycena indigotica TaxID=2126181 RepID=A0A8H6TGP0_9AGAR|nr:CNH domain-containing protein [Mycena indigotica]KAF7316392.1 CNH domain-containing protein [Mycena indigotica]